MARPLVFALLLMLAALGRAAAADIDEIKTKVYVVTPYFLADEGSRLPKTPGGQIDLRGYLKSRDIELPRNGEATYDPEAHQITVRAPQDILDRIDGVWSANVAQAVRVVFMLVEFSVADALDFPDLGYEKLRKLAGDSWRVNDRVTIIGKSGQKITGSTMGKREPPGKAVSRIEEKERDFINAPISENQFGTRVELEPQIGPDDVTVDLSYDYFHRSRPAGDQPPMLLRSNLNATLTHNAPLVAQSGTLAVPKGAGARGPAKEWALIIQVSVLDRYGRSVTRERNPDTADPLAIPGR